MKFDSIIRMVEFRVKQASSAPITARSIIFGVITAIAVGVTALYPALRSTDKSILTVGWTWDVIAAGFFPLIFTFWLKYSDRVSKKMSFTKTGREHRVTRHTLVSQALATIQKAQADRKFPPGEPRKCRERLLEAAAKSIDELLGLSTSQGITANLLVFDDNSDLGTMSVAYCSSRSRVASSRRPRENLLAFAAIKKRAYQLVNDISDDARWDDLPKTKYRTVIAVPVGAAGKYFGAITLDYTLPYAFAGLGTDLAMQLEPYALTLALTYGLNNPYYETHDGAGSC